MTSEYIVSNVDELVQALWSATGGDTILLADGEYQDIRLDARNREKFLKYDDTVTIKPVNDNARPVFKDLFMRDAQNIRIEDVLFDYDTRPSHPLKHRPFQIKSGENIALVGVTVRGDEASDGPYAGLPVGVGLTVSAVSGFLLQDSVIETWWGGAQISGQSDTRIVGNVIRDMRSEWLNFGKLDGAVIENNLLHMSRQAFGSGDHPDMIQFWTTNYDAASNNVVIRNNVFDNADTSGVHTIYFQNQEVKRGAGEEMFYRDLMIEDNVIRNAHTHAITVEAAIGVTVRNNTIFENSEVVLAKDVAASIPRIYIDDWSQDVTLRENVGPRINASPAVDRDIGDNLMTQRDYIHGGNYVDDLFVNALSDTLGDASDLRALPGGLIEQRGIGAAATRFDTTPDGLDGFVAASPGVGREGLVYDLEARVYDANGPVDLVGATVTWRIDGDVVVTDAPGLLEHAFDAGGMRQVEADVALGDGRSVTVDKRVRVVDPIYLSLPFDDGLQDQSATVDPLIDDGGVLREDGGVRLSGGHLTYDAGPEYLGNGAYTVSVDIRKDPDDLGASGRLLQFNGAFVIDVRDHALTVALSTETDFLRKTFDYTGLRSADWKRVTLTFSAEDDFAAVYVDDRRVGVFDGVGAGPARLAKSQDFHIGSPWSTSFDGLVDNVTFRHGALSHAEIVAGLPDGDWVPPAEDLPAVDLPVDDSGDALVGDGRVIAQTGVAQGNHIQTTVTLDHSFDNPVVIATVSSLNGGEAVTARITDVNADSFTFFLEEPAARDGLHAVENVSWMVVEAGQWELEGGARIEAGVQALGTLAPQGGAEVAFAAPFDAGAAVLTTAQTHEGPDFIWTRTDGVGPEGFTLLMEEEEALNAGDHAVEQIGWLAMEVDADAVVVNGAREALNVGVGAQLDDRGDTISFSGDFDAAPVFLGGIATRNGTDPVGLRVDDLNRFGARLQLQEDQSFDLETAHVLENVHWIAINEAGLIYGDALIG